MSTRRPRLVLIAAPAGFGKTTLLSQWLADDAVNNPDTGVAWLSLDAEDNDPSRFLEHLVAALTTIDEFAEAGELVAAGQLSAEAVLTSVVNDLDLRPGNTVIALDDYHVIDNPDVQRAVAFLLEHLPQHVTIAIATRADPPLPLPRLRARGELVELRAADLRFTPDEASAFLADVMGLDLTDTQAAALAARTEGWPAGLQLAGLSLRGTDDADAFVDAFTGSHRFVLDYLVEEVLRHQPKTVRSFLLDTAVLSQLTGPLCDALTGRDDGASMIESLDRANLFIIPLDDQRHWYRYHHLFADALRARLTAQAPDRVPALHRAASDWYAVHGLPEDAVRHALAGDDPEQAAHLVERALPDIRRARRDGLLRDWLIALPDTVIRTSALLSTYRAHTRLIESDLEGVEAWLRHAEVALESNPPTPASDASAATHEELRTLPATIAIFRASAAQARGDTDASREYAREALAHCGPDDHMARGGALGFLGLGAFARGDLEEAVATFSEALQSLAAAGDVSDALGGTVVLGLMWLARGRPDEARRIFERALATAEQHRGAAIATVGDLHVGLAGVLIEQGDLDAAADHLATAATLGMSASLPENRFRWFVASSDLHRAQGDLAVAIDLMDQAEQAYLPGFFPDVRPIPAARARLHITQGRLDDGRAWAKDHRVRDVENPGYLDGYAQLTLVRLLLAEHCQHPSSTDDTQLDEALRRLDALEPEAIVGGRDGSVKEIRALRALVDTAVSGGVPSANWLPTEGEGSRGRERAAYPMSLGEGAPTVSEGLSEREVEVLRLLATALSGPDIARELFVSVNTLRTHTKHIFSKLGVNTRRGAVDRGRELELL
ncbi:LuxR C-terminal-related transcriptional regulator [Knoellia sp. S7-12]|uniref:LuxR C-terminal-related transcriptional regulator n=1 Tax=Knoellia sp. S7-12 TaxID=3126698 RepID=UPI003366D36F